MRILILSLLFSSLAFADCRLSLATDIARGTHAKLKLDFKADMNQGDYAYFEFSRKFIDQDYGMFANVLVVPFAALLDSFHMAGSGIVTGIDNSNTRLTTYFKKKKIDKRLQIGKKMEAFALINQAYAKKGEQIERMAKRLKWSVDKTSRRIKILNVAYGLCTGKQKGDKEIYNILKRRR
jgi:hypothetical protein